jgi:hypothetical protein
MNVRNSIPGGPLLGWWMVRDALLEQVEKRNDKKITEMAERHRYR